MSVLGTKWIPEKRTLAFRDLNSADRTKDSRRRHDMINVPESMRKSRFGGRRDE